MRTSVQFRLHFRSKSGGLTLTSFVIFMLVASVLTVLLFDTYLRNARIKRGEWIGTQMALTHRTVQDYIDRHTDGVQNAVRSGNRHFHGQASRQGAPPVELTWTIAEGPAHVVKIDQVNLEKMFQTMGIRPERARSDLGDYELILSMPTSNDAPIASLLYIKAPLTLRHSGNVDSLAIQSALRRLGTGSGVSLATGANNRTADFVHLSAHPGDSPAFIQNPQASKAAGILAMTNSMVGQHAESHLASAGGTIRGNLLAQSNIQLERLLVGSAWILDDTMYSYSKEGYDGTAIHVNYDTVFSFKDKQKNVRFEKQNIWAPKVDSDVGPLRNIQFFSDPIDVPQYSASCVPGQISLDGGRVTFCDESSQLKPIVHPPGDRGPSGEQGARGNNGKDRETVRDRPAPIPGLYWATWTASGETIKDVHHVGSSIDDHAYRLMRQVGSREWMRTVNDASNAATAFSARYVFLAYGTQYDVPLPPDFKSDGGVDSTSRPAQLPLAEHFPAGWVTREFDASRQATWETL